MKKILLVEPAYKNKYPPMGLMKISTYHKMLGDSVSFVKGIDRSLLNNVWDRIYVTTLFTFDFEVTINTINFYKMLVNNLDSFFVGGIMASLMPDKIIEKTGIQNDHILRGLFINSSFVGDDSNINIDQLPLDYDLLEEIAYKYPAGDNYFGYLTRGCPNHCAFCAVPILEPEFFVANTIIDQIKYIDEKFGPKQNLLLLDNNILNAPNLSSLVDDLCLAGFERGAKFIDPGCFSIIINRYQNGDRGSFLDKKLKIYLGDFKNKIKNEKLRIRFIELLIDSESADDYAQFIINHREELDNIIRKYLSKTPKARYIDFNQGVDARRINNENMKLLSRLAIRPLRIAFDDIKLKDKYVESVELANNNGIKEISNYILFNYKDKPEDLYERLKINIDLNKRLGIQIYSFPMKYSPIERTDRQFIGQHWNQKYLRAISAILQVTKGVVAAGSSFFEKAFGRSIEEYFNLLSMPREFIMFRSHFEETGHAHEWKMQFEALSLADRNELIRIISLPTNDIKNIEWPTKLKEILPFYLIKKDQYLGKDF